MITKKELRKARHKRHKRRRQAKKFAWSGAGMVVALVILLLVFSHTDDEHHKNMSCVRLAVDEDTDKETCVEWERAKTRRSRVVGGERPEQ